MTCVRVRVRVRVRVGGYVCICLCVRVREHVHCVLVCKKLRVKMCACEYVQWCVRILVPVLDLQQ